MTKHETALLFKDRPIFGLDIGFSTIKVMQLGKTGKDHHPQVLGYGTGEFDPSAITDGVITNPKIIAKAAHDLFDKHIVGAISTKRVVAATPATRTFNRTVQLPKLSHQELDEAIRLEAEQYIPVPLDQLYIDYDIFRQTADGLELLVVAAPRKIVDSYVTLTQILGLELVAIETSLGAAGRLFKRSPTSNIPTIFIDFGSVSTDISVFDGNLIATGTTNGGGDSFTSVIAKALGVKSEEANLIKTKYGLSVSKKQKEITTAADPLLQSLLKEIRRMIRYYEERAQTKRKIGQVLTLGGGANMPGINDWMTDHLRLPVRMCDPTEQLNFHRLQPFSATEKSMYATVAGLALADPKELLI